MGPVPLIDELRVVEHRSDRQQRVQQPLVQPGECGCWLDESDRDLSGVAEPRIGSRSDEELRLLGQYWRHGRDDIRGIRINIFAAEDEGGRDGQVQWPVLEAEAVPDAKGQQGQNNDESGHKLDSRSCPNASKPWVPGVDSDGTQVEPSAAFPDETTVLVLFTDRPMRASPVGPELDGALVHQHGAARPADDLQ